MPLSKYMFWELGLTPLRIGNYFDNSTQVNILKYIHLFYFRFVSPSYANVFRSFEVILNYCLQIHFEHTLFHYESLGGMVLLVFVAVAMAFEAEMKYRFGDMWYF